MFRLTVAALVGCLLAWFISACTRWNPEAREKEFQSALAECERLIEKHGSEWYRTVPDYCLSVYGEYNDRLMAEEKRQAIDQAMKQNAKPSGINDSVAPKSPDTE